MRRTHHEDEAMGSEGKSNHKKAQPDMRHALAHAGGRPSDSAWTPWQAGAVNGARANTVNGA
jgi:hypothetical protein